MGKKEVAGPAAPTPALAPKSSADVEAYYASRTGDLGEILRDLRRHIYRLGPGLTEKLAWSAPCFIGQERVFSLRAQSSEHVALQIWYGARLAEKYPRIEGTGKFLRHVKVRTLEDVDPELLEIMAEALLLDATQPTRVR